MSFTSRDITKLSGMAPPEKLQDFRAPRAEKAIPQDESRERRTLRESCQQFEGILLGMLWKNMFAHARSLDGEDERPFGAMEDLAVEMAAESISTSGGVGLWKMLYAQLAESLPEKNQDPS